MTAWKAVPRDLMGNNLRMLQGYKVLDICQFVAGPTCTRMLAELGADVIKIEPAPTGDRSRAMMIVRDGMSTYYFQHNHSKRAIALDLTKPRARELVKAMVPKFDVVVQSFTPGVMKRMGLDYPALKAVHPALIMCSISMAGQTGPLAEKPGFDVIGQAYAGVTDLVGEPDRPPAVLPMALGDVSTGVAAAMSIAVAIIHRMRTGEGQHIDASLLDTYFHMHAMDVPAVAMRPKYHPRREGARSTVYPPGVFRANGGYIVLMATGHQWPKFTQAIGRPELEHDPRFKEMRTRLKNNDALREIVEQWLAQQPSVEAAVELLGQAHIPCAPVLELRDAMRHPHIVGRQTVRKAHDRGLGDFELPGMPTKFSAWPGDRTDLQAPRLGEHNEEVLREVLDLSDAEIADLYAQRVLVKYQAPS